MTSVIKLANPRAGFVYAEAAANPSHPTGIRYYQGLGYKRVPVSIAKELLAESDCRPVSEGGFVDKTNNCITNGDVVLMDMPVEEYAKSRGIRESRILGKYDRLKDELKSDADNVLFDMKKDT